ncbi:MAG: serine/threonine-protein kinase [Myxococcota bacterium]
MSAAGHHQDEDPRRSDAVRRRQQPRPANATPSLVDEAGTGESAGSQRRSATDEALMLPAAGATLDDTETALAKGAVPSPEGRRHGQIDAVEQPRVSETPRSRATAPQTLGRYAVLDTLGRGGMGTVRRAYDRQLNRQVALKLLRRGLGTKQTSRLHREALALAKLSHPNVVQVYEVGEIEGQTFVAMELVEGITIERWMRQEPRPDWRACVRVFVQLGAGLAAAHERRLVHRDFKPSNAIIDNRGRARVVDFGLARHGDELDEVETSEAQQRARTTECGPLDVPLTITGAVLGTPAYMPLEQMHGRQADARSDQFSFCVSLYEALYGERPFDGATMTELMAVMHCGEVRPPPRGRKIPNALRMVLLRGLASLPEERWPSMDALLEQLRRLVDPRWSRRLALWTGGGLLMLGLGLGLGMDRLVQSGSQCTGAQAQLQGVWDEPRKRQVRGALLGTELSYARATWERVESGVNAYAEAWVHEYTEACEASTIRGEQSPEIMDLRMACLLKRRQHMRAMVDELSQANATVVSQAVQAVAGLPRVSQCADLEALEAEVPPPQDPAVAEQVAALEERLVEVNAKEAAGKFAEGLEVADAVVTEAWTLGYEPLRARAWIWQGKLRIQLGEFEGAVTSLERAYDVAVAHRMSTEAAKASSGLVYVLGHELARYDEARRWAKQADPLSRASRSDESRASYLHNLGIVAYSEGEYDEAQQLLERALALHRETHGPHHSNVAGILNILGMVASYRGDLSEARSSFELALTRWQEAMGPEHPHVATALTNLGHVARSQGQLDEARAFQRRALRILEQAQGPRSSGVAFCMHNLGSIAHAQGQLDEARDFQRRAVDLWTELRGAGHPLVATALSSLGAVERSRGQLDEALDLQQRALAIAEQALGPDHPDVADPLTELGRVWLDRSEPSLALPRLERALAIRSTQSTTPQWLAELRFLLARALWAATDEGGRDRPRARRLAEQARQSLATAESSDKLSLPVAEVETWLREHPTSLVPAYDAVPGAETKRLPGDDVDRQQLEGTVGRHDPPDLLMTEPAP